MKRADKLGEINLEALFERAWKNAGGAYAPYSHFHVGAALLGVDGVIYDGVNVENRSYGLSICAERSAVVSAVTRGQTRFAALAIATPDAEYPVGPCGACRQVLSEFMERTAPVVFGGKGSEKVHTTIGELYPFDSLHELAQP
jgi:cytidine deaminase